MRALYGRLLMVSTVLLVASAVAHGGPAPMLVASVAVIAVASLVALRYAVLAVGSREMTVGARAHAHKEALIGMPAPSHPSTAGRPRTRAPSQSILAA